MPSPLPLPIHAAEVGAALNARQCPSAPFLASLDRDASTGRGELRGELRAEWTGNALKSGHASRVLTILARLTERLITKLIHARTCPARATSRSKFRDVNKQKERERESALKSATPQDRSA